MFSEPRPWRAAGALAAQVGVVDLHHAAQPAVGLVLRHGLHQLVFQAPGAAVAHAQVPAQLQHGDGVLALAEQVQRQEPNRQRQLAGREQRAGAQAGLRPAGPALPVRLPEARERVRLPGAAARTHEPARPARLCQRLLAGGLVAVTLKELGQTQPRLELNAVHRHGCDLGRSQAPTVRHDRPES